MKKSLLIGGLSFMAGILTFVISFVGLQDKQDNMILYEDDKIRMTELIHYDCDDSKLAYIQMKR